MAKSSLIPEEEPRGRNAGGGGVVLAPPMLLDSENDSQKFFPFEFFIVCCLKLRDRPDARSPIMSSSLNSSGQSWLARTGDDAAVLESAWSDAGGIRGSMATSLSRTCLMTSASCRTSVSAGAVSSARAARMRAKFLVLGCIACQLPPAFVVSYSRLTRRLPRRLATRRTIVLCPSPL